MAEKTEQIILPGVLQLFFSTFFAMYACIDSGGNSVGKDLDLPLHQAMTGKQFWCLWKTATNDPVTILLWMEEIWLTSWYGESTIIYRAFIHLKWCRISSVWPLFWRLGSSQGHAPKNNLAVFSRFVCFLLHSPLCNRTFFDPQLKWRTQRGCRWYPLDQQEEFRVAGACVPFLTVE